MNLIGTEYKLPYQFTAVIIFFSILPAILNLMGFNFSLSLPDTNEPGNLSPLSAANYDVEFLGPVVYAIIDWIAITLAWSAAIFALFHYSFSHNAMILLLGFMLFVSTVGDAYHSIFAYNFINSSVANEEFIPFIWVISRIIRFAILTLCLLLLLYFDVKKIVLKPLFLAFTGLVFIIFSILLLYFLSTFDSVPRIYYHDQFIERPWDLLPLVFLLLITLPTLLKFNKVFPSYFSHSLLIAIIPTALTQLYFMIGSDELYNNNFMIAAYLRLVAHSTILVGICFDYLRAHQEKNWAYDELQSAMEQRDQAHAAKIRNIDNVSDQIRSSMNGVTGICHLLLNTDLDQNQRKLTRIIHQSSKKFLGIVGEILDLSKVSYKKMEIQLSLFDIKKLFMDTIEKIQKTATPQQPKLSVRFSSEIPSFVYGDQEIIKDIIKCLLSNLIMHPPKIPLTLELSGHRLRDNQWNYLLEIGYIHDDIDQSFIDCNDIIKKINGTLTIQKMDQNRRILRVNLFLEARKTSNIPHNLSEFLLGYKGLVVDTDENTRYRIAELIKTFGMQCKAVNGAEQALDILKKGESFDIFLIGHTLSLNAFQLADRLIQDPACRSSMFVIMSVATDEEWERSQPGQKKVIQKSPSPSDLFYVLSDLVYKENEQEKAMPLFPFKALIIEADSVNQYVLKEYLENYGCTVDIVSEGKEALEICQAKLYDCIFIDCCFPSMDGPELLKGLRHKGSKAYIIGLTSEIVSSSKDTLRRAQMDAELSKPIDDAELLVLLQKVARFNMPK